MAGVLIKLLHKPVIKIIGTASLTGHTAVENIHSVYPCVLAKLHKLVKSEPVGGVISPQQAVRSALPNRSYAVLKTVGGLPCEAFDNAASGETPEGRFKPYKHSGQVFSKPVFSAAKSINGEQRCKPDSYRFTRIRIQFKRRIKVGLVCLENALVFCIFALYNKGMTVAYADAAA